MTVLVLDSPELVAHAAIATGFTAANLEADTRRPHRMKFHFGFNKHALAADDIAFLEQHAAYLKSRPSISVRIHGHADNFGPENYNRFLSRLRASVIARFLTQGGVPESRIMMRHWGSVRPLARPEDRAANRRVELEYLTMDVARDVSVNRTPARHSTAAARRQPEAQARSAKCRSSGPSETRRAR